MKQPEPLALSLGRRRSHTRAAMLILVVALVAGPALAQENILDDKWTIRLGSYFTSIDTDIRLDSDRIDGDRFDLETDLDLDNSDTLGRLEVEYRFFRRHQVNFSYYELSRSSQKTITRDIQIRDRLIPLSADVGARFRSEFLEFSYTYWAVRKERVAFGITGGVAFISAGTDLAFQLRDDGGDLFDEGESASADVPIPTVGFEVRYAIHPRLMLRAFSSLIDADIDDEVSGRFLVYGVGLEHRTFSRVGFGVSLNAIDLKAEVKRRFWNGEVGYRISGIQVYLRLGFQ